ncbi:MAG: hypothetical protein NTZ83_04430 [Candidatus Pacearchaeota archaeon]|nr:hypothetical protein [Candidatus Pacearchaeota archaeon]
MEDDEFDNFKYEVAIASILYDIERKGELNDTCKLYIDWVKGYIQRINKTLDSILDESYISTPHFVEVVKALANKQKDIPKEDIPKYKEEFNSINSKLDNLKKNPQEFYNTKDSKYIFDFMKKIEPIFQRPYVPIMTCCDEHIPGDD